MGSKQGHEVSLFGTALNGFKLDFNTLLTKTLRAMQEKGVEDATVTAKIDITLSTEEGPNLYAPDSEQERECISPKFKHKVTATLHVKEDLSGKTGGKAYELKYDSFAGVYVMALVKDDGQTTLFDRDPDGDADSKQNDEEESSVTVDEVLEAATAIVREAGIASVALLQRKMHIGYKLAAALLDKLEELGIVGPFNGDAPREVLTEDKEDGGEEE